MSTFLPRCAFRGSQFSRACSDSRMAQTGVRRLVHRDRSRGFELSGRAAGGDGVPASFDCAMRKAAYSFGQKLLPRLGKFSELYYALDLNRSGGTHQLCSRRSCGLRRFDSAVRGARAARQRRLPAPSKLRCSAHYHLPASASSLCAAMTATTRYEIHQPSERMGFKDRRRRVILFAA